MSREASARKAAAYGIALACGVLLLFTLMPLDAISGTGGLWRSPAADMAQGLTGHLALQQDAWRFPPLFAKNLFWPHGVSIALTDSNPLFSQLAKLLAPRPVNLLGAWLACCWVFQPVSAVYALRALSRSLAGAATVAVLAGLFPALLFRIGHVNLCGHFLILLALGLSLRLLQDATRRRWIAAGAVLTVAILCHPYLFMAGAATLAAPPLQATIRRGPDWWRAWPPYLVACIVPVIVFVTLAGTLGGGDKGFVTYSMNLLSPFWPQRSGLFGPGLPVIDATGGQYEGFCYLGAGSLLLLIAALPRAGGLRRWPGLVVVLAGLTLIALSSRVYVGHFKLIDLGAKPWEDIFAVFRASGRAFWPVGYALVIGAVAAVCRMPLQLRLPLLAAAIVLQVVDTTPLRLAAEDALAGRIATAGALPALPAGGTLLTVLPTPGCGVDPTSRALSSPVLLAGVRAGMRLGDVGVGRAPSWFNCEEVLSDGLELPLRPHEIRVFTDPAAQQALRPALLGPDAICRRDTGAVLCGRHVAMPADEPVTVTGAAARLDLPASGLSGPRLVPYLGFGWRVAADGGVWSEGPRASLLLGVEPGHDLRLVLRIEGIATRPGDARRVIVSARHERLAELDLPDREPRDLALRIPRSAIEDGTLRLALDFFRPVDPERRGLAAPVHRAAVRLLSLDLAAEPRP